MNKPDMASPDPWAQHERSQALYFSSLSLQEKMEAVEAMADLVRHFQKLRAEGAFRPAAASEERNG